MKKPPASSTAPNLMGTSANPNPNINKGLLYWSRFGLLLCLVIFAGMFFATLIPNPF
jgi:hypothetical protein